MSRLIEINKKDNKLVFDDGVELYSEHEQDCCEHHELTLTDLEMSDFQDLEFDFTNGKFFNRIEGYGIELLPIKGHSVKIPGHGSNNGYYSDNLMLVVQSKDKRTIYDITECQEIDY